MFLNCVYGAEIRVVEPGGQLGVAFDSLFGQRVVGELTKQELERNLASQLHIFALVDLFIPASDDSKNAIMGNCLTHK